MAAQDFGVDQPPPDAGNDWWSSFLPGDQVSAPPPAAPAQASGTDFGAAPAAFVNPTQTFTPAQQQGWVAPQFTEAAPTFAAPDAVTEQNDPGYKFRIQQAMDAIQRSAAARGTVLNPGTVQDLTQRVGDQSSAEFGNVFNRAATTFDKSLATYGAKYNTFMGNAGLSQAANASQNAAIGANNVSGFTAMGANNDAAARQYGINFDANRATQTDYWNRLQDVAKAGQDAAKSTVTA